MLAALGHAYALGGKQADAQAMIDKLAKLAAARTYVSSYGVALIYVALTEKDAAFQWFERAFQERDENFIHLKVDPRLDPIRSEPRFQQLLQRVNLAS